MATRYDIEKQVGDGTYGVVMKAMQKETGDTVAIKKMKRRFYTWQECMELREIRSLKKLSHVNIVKLKEVIRENDELFFVFEFCDNNVYQLMEANRSAGKLITAAWVKRTMTQLLNGLGYMHKHGFFHRDLKPENLLTTGQSETCTIKIADFGLAREIRSRPPYTDYVSTRWYRAPEVLLRSVHYNSPIDMWACGVIMAEMYILRPLFPGTSESDMMFKLCSLLGIPTQQTWPEGIRLAKEMGYSFPTALAPTPLDTTLEHGFSARGEMQKRPALQVLSSLLQFDPNKRPTVLELLQLPWFASD